MVDFKVVPIDMSQLFQDNKSSINAHYGMNDKEFLEFCGESAKWLVKSREYSDALDELFKNLSAEDRAKVFAFAVTFYHHKKGME